MTEFFLKIVNMSISASWIVLAVLLLRFVLKKAPKWITVLLWGIVAVRLICPFNFESVMSLIPSAETINPEVTLNSPVIDSGVPMIDNVINPIIGETTITSQPEKEVNLFQVIMPYLAELWLVGVTVMLVYTVISFLRVKRKIGTAVLLKDNIYQSENVVSPFVLGIIKPKIFLPFHMNEQNMEHVIAHELAHIKRRDHWWKPLGFLILTIHWFNPFVWLGYVLLCRDIELACDEKVVKDFDKEQKADYSQALLTCSVNRRMIAACPLAFGEIGVKGRVKSVLNYKKPAFWIVLIAIIASIVVAVCFLTNPKSPRWQSNNYMIHCNVISAECDNVVYEYKYGTLNENYPYICVDWTNNTEDVLCFGSEFVIYKEDKVYNPKGEVFFEDNLMLVKQNGHKSENYDLSAYDLEPEQTYRLEKTFYLQSKPEIKYTAYIVFSIDETYSFVGKQYIGEEIVFEDWSYSSVIYTEDSMPEFKITENTFELYSTHESVDSKMEKLGILHPIKLSKENFDERFVGAINIKEIRKNNLNAFSVTSSKGAIYCLLEQTNGDIYIAIDGGVNNFRWLIKMREVENTSMSNINAVDGPQSVMTSVIDGATFDIDSDEQEYSYWGEQGVGSVDGLQVTYGTAKVIETISDTKESSYQVGVDLPGTDFSSMGKELKDKITQEWKTYDGMTEVQKLTSSKLWGTVGITTDTWNECEDAIGFDVYNPLESFEWLNKTGYFGMESTDPSNPATHVRAMAYATQTTDRSINEINITAGYNNDSVKITLTATISSNAGTLTTFSVCNGYATYEQETTTTGTGIPVLVVTTNETNNTEYYNGNYFDPTAYWVKDNVFYTLRVFGEEADKSKIQDTLDRILAEI